MFNRRRPRMPPPLPPPPPPPPPRESPPPPFDDLEDPFESLPSTNINPSQQTTQEIQTLLGEAITNILDSGFIRKILYQLEILYINTDNSTNE